jgi:hypothetical protein
MVIIGDKANQLGNRLFTFAQFIANAIEQHYAVLNPAFFDFAHFFESTRRNLLCRYPAPIPLPAPGRLRRGLFHGVQRLKTKSQHSGWLRRWVGLLDITETHDRQNLAYDLTQPEFGALIRASPILIVGGWGFRDYTAIHRQAGIIRRYFTPLAVYRAHVAHVLSEARRDCEVLVGVHIRQGDYATFLRGRYFFQTAEYVALMQRALDLWPGQRVRFFICSNVPQPAEQLSPIPYCLGSGHVIEDLYALAGCDFLIGVSSTYSGWASYYGQVPMFKFDDPLQPISLDQFQTWVG